MFDDNTLSSRNAEPFDDAAILALFREWCEAIRHLEALPNASDDDPERVAAHARCSSLEAAISDTASTGPAGLAVKIYIETFHEHGCRSADPCEIGKHKDQRINETLLSALRDARRFLPELAPLCAAVLDEDEQPSDDAALLAADRELTNLKEREKAVYRAHPNISVEDEQRLVCDVFDKALRAVENRIAATPPTTFAGAAVKLRRLFETGIAGAMSDIDVASLRQVQALIEREACATATPAV